MLELGGVDMILGVAWLETLGNVEMDWGAMSMSFKSGDETVTLQGMKLSNSKKNIVDSFEVGADSLLGMMDKSVKLVEGVLWNMEGDLNVKETGEMTSQQKRDLEHLIASFPEVFKEISGLPPPREFAHSIVIKEGTKPISVRAY